ncbi:uncharacterized protein LOC123312873 [Coccinella septempunctata]|uniref:uncharacterized protein LOC123312873 n=1 Tax=Coccinella septempunctata TaxID=41139 RepID=UPI001D099763|nr:uncharacterized protein LOC123312873 [Coccinella septempunctata]
MPDVQWPLTNDRSCSSASAIYVDTIRENNLFQLVDQPTRFRKNQNPSLLDLILVNDPHLIASTEFLPPFGRSDHVTSVSKVQLSIPKSSKVTKRIKIINYDALNTKLQNIVWSDVLQSTDCVESMWSAFTSTLSHELETCTTYRSKVVILSKPWIDQSMLRMMRTKKSLWQRYLRSRRDTDSWLPERQCFRVCRDLE